MFQKQRWAWRAMCTSYMVLFSFSPTAPTLMVYHTLNGVIKIEQIKIFLFIQPAAHWSSFWRMKSCPKPSYGPLRAGAHVSSLKATESAYTPSLTRQLNMRGSHILRERGAASQTIFWKSFVSSTVKLFHLKIQLGVPQSYKELQTYCVHICSNYQLSTLCHPSNKKLIQVLMWNKRRIGSQ